MTEVKDVVGVWPSRSEADTVEIGFRVGTALYPTGVVLLEGDLGAGKTVFVRGLAQAVGVDPSEVQSPSYALIHEHDSARGSLVHVDLYRLRAVETESLGLDELLAGQGLKAIEWPGRLPTRPPRAIVVALERQPDGGRRIEIRLRDES